MMEPSGIAALLANITAVVTACVSWITSYMSAVTHTGNELLLVFFALPLVGMGIGALKRLANQ